MMSQKATSRVALCVMIMCNVLLNTCSGDVCTLVIFKIHFCRPFSYCVIVKIHFCRPSSCCVSTGDIDTRVDALEGKMDAILGMLQRMNPGTLRVQSSMEMHSRAINEVRVPHLTSLHAQVNKRLNLLRRHLLPRRRTLAKTLTIPMSVERGLRKGSVRRTLHSWNQAVGRVASCVDALQAVEASAKRLKTNKARQQRRRQRE